MDPAAVPVDSSRAIWLLSQAPSMTAATKARITP